MDQRRGHLGRAGRWGGKFDGIFELVTRDLLVRDTKRLGTGPYGQARIVIVELSYNSDIDDNYMYM